MKLEELNIEIIKSNIELIKENIRLKEDSSKALDAIIKLTIDLNHFQRADKHYKKLIIDKNKIIEWLNVDIEAKNKIIQCKDIIIKVERETNGVLQRQLDKYIEHMSIGV